MFNIQQSYDQAAKHDALIIGLFEKKQSTNTAQEVDELLDGQITTLKKNKKISTKRGKVTPLYTLQKLECDVIYIVGLGKEEELDAEGLREVFAAAGKKAGSDRLKNIAIDLDSFRSEAAELEDLAVLAGESLALSTYQVADYKEKTNEVDVSIEEVTFYAASGTEGLVEAADCGFAYGKGTNRARKLINIPGNLLTPTELAKEAKELADQHGFEYDVLEKEDMEKLGMGALLAVAKGSDEPPKMIVLKYQAKDTWDDVLGFVGKGLTFDSGGISIKPRENMHQMKMDMGGAAAVLGAMDIIGEMKPDVNVLAVIPSSENMLNGSALKPGDVIRAMDGKTIEVRNTDAEGRLILADGVAYAKQLGATNLVDVATLTGAVLIALGDCTTGAVTNNESFMEEVLEASVETGEWIWRLPSYKPYRDMLKTSDVADLNNAPGRLAGSITAGLFIGEFAGDTPWVHLDIAGTAWNSKPNNLCPLGGTGVMARTLAQLAMNREEIE
ncbi:leucyl aminopeptidase [Alkalihalophilus pseudofirmus]|uniref:Probable cytosol aminopeptidase n=1 Tax=Alkalihalophilus marmarensis DSM 21297 TaxID=1188261 RepID=U6SKD7_9BACI|nr:MULTISPECIES: leucyl aminopeptidase [Alkalihalophilus]ERN52204.1 aminopeptidase A [Alkalihalophilus marmarensis DSM 21297]OLS33930.1 leucyl aminopeptidase [Alkalihalophilus pseudofirmus]WEG16408.1 leucyl aminopeptidase [Alkalihalophilus pseudofirmus]